MPSFDRSATLATDVTSTGAGTPYWASGRIEKPSFQVNGSSFNLDIQATNYFYPAGGAGSYWVTVASGLTASGLYNSDHKLGAFRAQVNSVSSGANVSVSLFG